MDFVPIVEGEGVVFSEPLLPFDLKDFFDDFAFHISTIHHENAKMQILCQKLFKTQHLTTLIPEKKFLTR